MAFTRPLASVAAVTLLVLVLLAVLPDCASACSCGMIGGQKGAKIALSNSAAVFSGEVLDVEEGPLTKMFGGEVPLASSRVTLRVSEVWKGPKRETLEVSTARGEMSCGYPFKEGQEYLVYASGKEEPFKVPVCTQTKPLSEAGTNLQVLRDGESMGGGGALVDTSGGFLGLWIIGMMGLAMAAVSSVVLVRLLRTS